MTEYNEQRVKEVMGMFSNNREMAEELEVSERTMRRWKAKLALSGYSPEHQMTRQVPKPYIVKGLSQLYKQSCACLARCRTSKMNPLGDLYSLPSSMYSIMRSLFYDKKRPIGRFTMGLRCSGRRRGGHRLSCIMTQLCILVRL